MNDRELLELAAKAAGIRVNPWHEKYGLLLSDFDFEPWNPLTDDGDALRLAVKLNLTVRVCGGIHNDTLVESMQGRECIENHKNDPYAATRRAIVRTAAEIGKEPK